MPRISYAQEGTEAEGATEVYASLKAGFGMVPNLVKLVGHSGPVTQAMGTVLDVYFNRLALDARLREIAYLTVTRLNECPYCTGHHTMFAQKAGMSEEEMALLGESGLSSPLFTPAEKAVIRFALETTKHVKASDESLMALKKAFTLPQVVEIAFVVASANFIQRIGKNFDAELEM